jgi:hypothetical protein
MKCITNTKVREGKCLVCKKLFVHINWITQECAHSIQQAMNEAQRELVTKVKQAKGVNKLIKFINDTMETLMLGQDREVVKLD